MVQCTQLLARGHAIHQCFKRMLGYFIRKIIRVRSRTDLPRHSSARLKFRELTVGTWGRVFDRQRRTRRGAVYLQRQLLLGSE